MASATLFALLFLCLVLLSTATPTETELETVDHQQLTRCGRCPRRCYRRRNAAVRDCGRPCTMGQRCRVARCSRRSGRGFQCRGPRRRPTQMRPPRPPAPAPVPAPAPAPAPVFTFDTCPNQCTSNQALAIAQCAPVAFQNLGCRVRSCVLSATANGFICALPGPVSPTPSASPSTSSTPSPSVTPTPSNSPGVSPSPSMTPGASPSPSVSATPSLTPTPSPDCTFTVEGGIGAAAAIDGVCRCGTRSRSIIVLDPAGPQETMDTPCYNACLRPLIDSLCSINGFPFFVENAEVVVDTCCTACTGTISRVTNQCVFNP